MVSTMSKYFWTSKKNSLISYCGYIVCLHEGIEPWTFVQKLGEAVFIPAGCPHQVRNIKVTNVHFWTFHAL